MTWAQNPQGALLAIRNVLRAGIDAQLVLKNTAITAQGLSYQLPTTVLNDNIRLRNTVFRPIPQNIPAIKVVYENRTVIPTASRGLATTNPTFVLHYWFTTNVFDTGADLDSEEVLTLSCMDFGDVILKTLQQFSNGTYGEADASISDTQETSQTYVEAYQDDNFGTYTIEGRLRVRLIQDAEYL